MTLTEWTQAFESRTYDANFNAISSLSTFRSALADDHLIQQTIQALQQSVLQRREIFHRLVELVDLQHNYEQEHPYDVAVAIYLHILSQTSVDLLGIAIEKVLVTPNFWWSGRLAQALQTSVLSG